MSEEAKKELNEMSIIEIYNLLDRVNKLKTEVKEKIVEINPEDLKPKRKKRGSKN